MSNDYDDYDDDTYYDDYDDYDSYDTYEDTADGGGDSTEDHADSDYYDSYEEYEDDPQGSISLEDLVENRPQQTPPDDESAAKRRRLLLIIGIIAFLFIGLPLICGLIATIAGVSAFAMLLGTADLEPAAQPTPIVTLMPTAAVQLPPTETPLPSPTPTLAPLSVNFLSPAPGVTLDKGQSIDIVVQAIDGNGISSVSLEAPNVNFVPQSFNGETEVTFQQRWAPENAGFYNLNVRVRNRLGEFTIVDGIELQVVDRDFLTSNAGTFTKLNTNVALLRGLSLLEPIEPMLMGRSGVANYFRTEFTPEDAYQQMLILSAFDFIPRGFDLYEPAIEYAGNSVAGFYEPGSDLFVIVSTDNEMDEYEQLIYTHELMHVLQDQHFELGLLAQDLIRGQDETQALRALAEGEAELLEELYLQSGFFTEAEVVNIRNIAEERARIITNRQNISQAPEIWGNAFYFAYEDGLTFARTLYNQNGWDGLTAAWQNRPTSTEQILHPERYLAGDIPQEVTLVDVSKLLGESWREIERTTLGEFYLREYLAQRLDPAIVATAATGWGGDQYTVYWNGDNNQPQIAMALRLAWDTPNDSAEFANAFNTYADSTYGSAAVNIGEDGTICRTAVETVCITPRNTDWLIVRAPDQDTAIAIIGAQP